MPLKTYAEAINEAHRQLLKTDDRVFVMGQGVDSPWCVGSTTVGLVSEFGPKRVRETPISENCMTGACIGAAMVGMRPIVFHPRMDFMYYAMDQIINHCAHWSYMFGGQVNVPVTIRGIINRGNEQAAQHSQSPLAMYVHVPGLKVVAPASPFDAKGLLISSVRDDNPVIYVDDRWLYGMAEDIPIEMYEVPIGKARICRAGNDVTVIAISYLVPEAVAAADELREEGISADVIDIRTLKPLDENAILESVSKTGHLVVADPEWPCCGMADYIASLVLRKSFNHIKTPPVLITLPDAPAPSSTILEKAFYPRREEIQAAIRKVCA